MKASAGVARSRGDIPRATVWAVLLSGVWAATAESQDVSFKDHVAPILRAKCVRCHGADARKGGLALDTAAHLAEGGDEGPAIEVGKPEESPLLEKISGPKPTMPKGGKPLTDAEVAVIRRWIASGAGWPEGLVLEAPKADPADWWAVKPLVRPAVPRVRAVGRMRTPIDAFLLQALEAKGLTFRVEADRPTLIRRLTFDLTGLPPTPEEIDAFVGDPSKDAYERLVDRLLASPAYGERWGRHWLDVAHYGDSHGYDKDKRRDRAWPYRDWVIGAFNNDLPYDRFITDQIAGDVLRAGDPNALIATGFVAAGPWDFVGHVELGEATLEKAKTRSLDRDDMVTNAITSFDSLTVGCARCHDHKFDPIPQKDYYRLQAVFAGVDRGERPFDLTDVQARQAELGRKRAEASARRDALEARIRAKTSPELTALENRVTELGREYTAMVDPNAPIDSPTNGYHSGIYSKPETPVWVQVDLGKRLPIDEIRIHPARPTDFTDSPGFGFPEVWRLEASDDPQFARPVVVMQEARSEGERVPDEPRIVRPTGLVARYVRMSADRLWKRSGDYVFALAELEVLSGGANAARGAAVGASDTIEAGRWSTKYLVDGFSSRHALPAADDPKALRKADLRFRIDTLEAERRRLSDSLIEPSLRIELQAVKDALKVLEREAAAIKPGLTVYAPKPLERPRPIFVLGRGEVEKPGESVSAGALGCVPGLSADFAAAGDDEGKRRAMLAVWVADPRNVLTWRSIVNRVWHYHFGRGIVDTPNDFGRNGSAPTHSALLDWLAVEFREGRKSLKDLHRLIVRSEAYRQASTDDPTARAVDADDRLLWRQNRRRLEAESLRDAVLAVSGRLDRRMGGPAYEPFRFKDDHSPTYDHDDVAHATDPATFRRTVYRFAVRSVPDPFVECLDGADPNANVPVRNTTITPLQALALLNDPFMLVQATSFADSIQAATADPAARIDLAYRRAFGRLPKADERQALTSYAERFGLARAFRLLLNANEFLFVD